MQTDKRAGTLGLIDHYMSLGFEVIPLKGKVPLVRWKEFVLTNENKRQWISKGCDWGIKTGLLACGCWLYVVDIDSKGLLAGLYESNPCLVGAPLVSSGRGWHVYLCWKDAVQSRRLDGVDIKGEGGYVACPPSVHESGKPYRWIVPLNGLPSHYNPEWLGLRPSETQTVPPTIVINTNSHLGHGSIPAGVPEGQRHTTLVSYLGAMHKACFTEDEALSRALTCNGKNRPPMSKQEVIATVTDCYERWDRVW